LLCQRLCGEGDGGVGTGAAGGKQRPQASCFLKHTPRSNSTCFGRVVQATNLHYAVFVPQSLTRRNQAQHAKPHPVKRLSKLDFFTTKRAEAPKTAAVESFPKTNRFIHASSSSWSDR
ncbi:unnamed protein product, partial [Ectocarpus sp. 12 AP-2014]